MLEYIRMGLPVEGDALQSEFWPAANYALSDRYASCMVSCEHDHDLLTAARLHHAVQNAEPLSVL